MKKTTKINLGSKSILNTGLYGLLCSFGLACSPSPPPKAVEEAKTTEKVKPLNDHLIAYIDSASRRMNDSGFDSLQFVALTDSFMHYFPISVYKPGQKMNDSTVLVMMHKSNGPLEDDVLTVTLPRTLGTRLDFKTITDHFGPLDPEPALFRQHKNPPPVSLSLKKHFNPPVNGLSLSISAAHFPEAANNQIVSVQVLKSKTK